MLTAACDRNTVRDALVKLPDSTTATKVRNKSISSSGNIRFIRSAYDSIQFNSLEQLMVNLQTMDVNYGIQTFDSSIRCRDGDPRIAWYFCDARPGAVGYRFSGQ